MSMVRAGVKLAVEYVTNNTGSPATVKDVRIESDRSYNYANVELGFIQLVGNHVLQTRVIVQISGTVGGLPRVVYADLKGEVQPADR